MEFRKVRKLDQLDTTDAPEWAKVLVRKVCEDYSVEIPFFVWRKIRYSNKHYSYAASGTCWLRTWYKDHNGFSCVGPKITIRTGDKAPERDMRYVILHELAHHIRNQRDGYSCGHAVKFWNTCFQLCQEYGVDIEYAKKKAIAYKKRTATKAAASLPSRDKE